MAKRITGISTVEVKNNASGGAIGTTYATLVSPTENGSVSDETPSTALGNGALHSAGVLVKLEVEVLDGASSLATLANLRTDSLNGVASTFKLTTITGATYVGVFDAYLIEEMANNKFGEHKKVKITAQKGASVWTDVITEA